MEIKLFQIVSKLFQNCFKITLGYETCLLSKTHIFLKKIIVLAVTRQKDESDFFEILISFRVTDN